jgi:hypothetical protein
MVCAKASTSSGWEAATWWIRATYSATAAHGTAGGAPGRKNST